MQIGGYDKGLQAQPFRQDGREEHCRGTVSCHKPSNDIINSQLNIIFLFCQIHRNVYLLSALRESIHHHSVPKLTTSLGLYAPPIHLHGCHEECVVYILMAGYHFLPIWLWPFLVLLLDSHAFYKALKPCQIFWLYQTYTSFP